MSKTAEQELNDMMARTTPEVSASTAIKSRKRGKYRLKNGRTVNIIGFEDVTETKPVAAKADIKFPKTMKAKKAFGKYMIGDSVTVVGLLQDGYAGKYKLSNGSVIGREYLSAIGEELNADSSETTKTYAVTDTGERVAVEDVDTFIEEAVATVKKNWKYIAIGVGVLAAAIVYFKFIKKGK